MEVCEGINRFCVVRGNKIGMGADLCGNIDFTSTPGQLEARWSSRFQFIADV
jgi:hypothetical protein